MQTENQKYIDRLEELKTLTNEFYPKLVDGGVTELSEAAGLIEEKGIVADIHVGRSDEMDDSPRGRVMIIEWFLGQLVAICENQSLFAVNSWINSKEEYCDKLHIKEEYSQIM